MITADTPLQRAARQIKLAFQFKQFGQRLYGDWLTTGAEINEFEATANTAACAVLTAALKVRWEEVAPDSDNFAGYLGSVRVGLVYRAHGNTWVAVTERPFKHVPDCLLPFAEAKAAIERVVLEAILGADFAA